MTTTTARYALNKIVEATDNVDVVNDFNVNWDAIDLKLGSQVCTSSTRPASPVQGMQIFETDTGATRTYSGSAWLSSEIMVCTTTTRPANPVVGDTIYETDTGDIAYYVGGSNWRYKNVISCTSSTRPTTAAGTSAAIYETDTKRFLIYNGSSWENKAFANFVCTSSTHPATPFQGLEIYETDTGMGAVYSGSNYQYALQQLAPTQTVAAASSITFSSVPAAKRILLLWRFISSASGGVDLEMQMDGNTGTNYLWGKNTGHANAASSSSSGAAVAFTKIGVVGGATANYSSNGHAWIDGWNQSGNFCSLASVATAWDTATGYWTETYAGQFNVVGPHSSIKLLPSSGTLTGEVSIYGAM